MGVFIQERFDAAKPGELAYRIIGDSFAEVQHSIDEIITASDVACASFDVPRRDRCRQEQWSAIGAVALHDQVPA